MLVLPNADETFTHGELLCRVLEKFLHENKVQFERRLIGNLRHINHRAECHNGIEVEDVQHVAGNAYSLDYSYEWHVYNGCANMDGQGDENDVISFQIGSDGEIKFDFTILNERTTHEEF